MLTWEKIGLSLTGDVGYGAYRTGADVWRSLPDMVVGDVCAQARRHLHTSRGVSRFDSQSERN